MGTVVLKFGGSSLANDENLKIVAKKIIKFYEKGYKVVVVVSAQGKTTNGLLSEAENLGNNINKRELDVLLSTGEQISMSKLAILLNNLNYPAISLTGWQAGIYTTNVNQNADIKCIKTKRICNELTKGNIVVVAGFQGLNENMDITTLGRGGSDTTAIAIASALGLQKCYMFKDVDGVYSDDPNKYGENATKFDFLSYNEMKDLVSNGARVLHDKCLSIAEKAGISIVVLPTFGEGRGTVISNRIISSNIIK